MGSSYNTVRNCYNTGDVSGQSNDGGVVGHNDGNTVIQNCFYIDGDNGRYYLDKNNYQDMSKSDMLTDKFLNTLNDWVSQSENKDLMYWKLDADKNFFFTTETIIFTDVSLTPIYWADTEIVHSESIDAEFDMFEGCTVGGTTISRPGIVNPNDGSFGSMIFSGDYGLVSFDRTTLSDASGEHLFSQSIAGSQIPSTSQMETELIRYALINSEGIPLMLFTPGSIIVSFTQYYLDTLPQGENELIISLTDGTTHSIVVENQDGNYIVNGENIDNSDANTDDEPPKTGNSVPSLAIVGILAISAFVIVAKKK